MGRGSCHHPDLLVPVQLGGLLHKDELQGSAQLHLSADGRRSHVRQLRFLLRLGGNHRSVVAVVVVEKKTILSN